LLDYRVHGRASFDHDLGFAWAFEGFDEIFESVGCHDVFTLGSSLGEFLGHRGGAVIHGHSETFALHVEHEVFTHHSEAD
jgi:hypothetical protein